MSYSEWAKDLTRKHFRLAGAYVVAVGAACFGVFYLVFLSTGMAYFAFVPAFCILFGLWMLIVGKPAIIAGRAPAWYRGGVIAIALLCLLAAFTAREWMPLLLGGVMHRRPG